MQARTKGTNDRRRPRYKCGVYNNALSFSSTDRQSSQSRFVGIACGVFVGETTSFVETEPWREIEREIRRDARQPHEFALG